MMITITIAVMICRLICLGSNILNFVLIIWIDSFIHQKVTKIFFLAHMFKTSTGNFNFRFCFFWCHLLLLYQIFKNLKMWLLIFNPCAPKPPNLLTIDYWLCSRKSGKKGQQRTNYEHVFKSSTSGMREIGD